MEIEFIQILETGLTSLVDGLMVDGKETVTQNHSDGFEL